MLANRSVLILLVFSCDKEEMGRSCVEALEQQYSQRVKPMRKACT